MKIIQRTDLQAEYTAIIEDSGDFFNPIYQAHGVMSECNFGGLLITLDRTGEACIIVRDWAGDEVLISEVLEIEYKILSEDDGEDSDACFELNGDFYSLSNFMRI